MHHLRSLFRGFAQRVRCGARAGAAIAQTVNDSPELYPGEKALYEEAQQGRHGRELRHRSTWANWAAQFAAFKRRYPDVEIIYNDLGSAATVVALEKARNRPQADTAYYFAASAVDAAKKNLVAPFKPVNFDKLPAVFRDPDGKWFTIHSLTIAFVVNTKLVKNVPQSWADLLKPEYKNSIVYLDPRSTGVGQVLTFAANFAHGGDMNNLQPGLDYLGKLHAVGQRAARARHHAVRAVRQGRDPDLDQLRERRPQGEVDRRPRRCGGGGDPEGGVGRRAVRRSAWSRKGRIPTPASCGSTSS